MLSGALKSVRHAQIHNFASRAVFKLLDLRNASPTGPPHSFSTLITLNAASTWKPPWPLQDKLAGLLNKPTVNSQTSGQTVFEKVDRSLDTKPPELSARAGHRGPNEHARDWDSREGIG